MNNMNRHIVEKTLAFVTGPDGKPVAGGELTVEALTTLQRVMALLAKSKMGESTGWYASGADRRERNELLRQWNEEL